MTDLKTMLKNYENFYLLDEARFMDLLTKSIELDFILRNENYTRYDIAEKLDEEIEDYVTIPLEIPSLEEEDDDYVE